MFLWMLGLFVFSSLLRMARKCFSTPNNVSKAALQIGQANGLSVFSSINLSVLGITGSVIGSPFC